MTTRKMTERMWANWREAGEPQVPWKDSVLRTKEDYGEALAGLTTAEEAEEFKRAFAAVFPEHTEWLLGYLTGDVSPENREPIQLLLGVTHPVPEYIRCFASTAPILASLVTGPYLEEHFPEQMKLVATIPRTNWSFEFHDE